MRVFNANHDTILQPDDFSCSISTTTWCVQSVGIDVTEPTMRGLMMPALVSAELGLLDGSGAGLARLLRDQWGLDAQHQQTVSFDEVAGRAGRQPIALGGHTWSGAIGHWVAVRRFENGQLVLMNPGGTGPRFGQQRVDRETFAELGPFSAVWINVGGESTGGTDGAAGTATLPPVPDVPLAPAGRFLVVRTDGIGVRVRSQPFMDAGRLGAAPEGAVLEGAEHAFRQARTSDGVTGWIADTYLDAVGQEPDVGGQEPGASQDGEWTPELGAACAAENYWDPDGQPRRRAAMERFNRLPRERRQAIFEAAMDQGLSDEGISDPGQRENWKRAMRAIVLGEGGFPGECPDMNPFMLAGESGGVFRGGADPAFGGLNSSALGYFQFLAQNPIPIGERFAPRHDYGHWRNAGPFPDDYGRQTDPVCQVRQFVRAIQRSGKHGGDPMSVVREKSTPPHVWGP